MSLQDLLLSTLIKIRLFFSRSEAASAIEYVLIVAMVALVVVTFVTPMGTVIKATFNKVVVALGGTAI